MLYKLKENLPTIEILLGCSIYLYFAIETTLSIALLWALFVIYLWLFTSILLKQYTLHAFVCLLCGTGIIVAITLFFMFGVEELPHPKGALIFHIDGIVKSLLLFFLSSTPLIIMNKKTEKTKRVSFTKKEESNQNEGKPYNESAWEEATLDDLQSGKFETI